MKKILLLSIISFFTSYSFSQQTSGIYYQSSDKELTKLGYSRISGSSVSNVAGAYFTLGLSSAKSNKTIEGSSAEIIIDKKDKKPNFTFVFGDDTLTGYMFTNSNNLEFFKLVRLNQKKKSRQLRNGKYGLIAGVQNGLNEDDVIPIKIEKQTDNTYIIVPKENLEKGEYCFYFIEKAPNNIDEFKSVFDFSIK